MSADRRVRNLAEDDVGLALLQEALETISSIGTKPDFALDRGRRFTERKLLLYGRKSLRVSELRIGVVGHQGYPKVDASLLRRRIEDATHGIAYQIAMLFFKWDAMMLRDTTEHPEHDLPAHEQELLRLLEAAARE